MFFEIISVEVLKFVYYLFNSVFKNYVWWNEDNKCGGFFLFVL